MSRAGHAQTEQKSADLATDFGLAYATRLFGEEAIASLPLRTAGKNKGKPKGYVLWLKTTTAGYHPCIGGGVAAGVVVRAWIGTGAFSPETDAVQGRWLGKTQTICGSRCYLGEEGRARAAAEQAVHAQDHAATMARAAAKEAVTA